MIDFQPADYWTPKRKELCSWFERNAPSLGELYKGALRMVFYDGFPGRVRFVAHAVREIRNRLPDVIAGSTFSNPLQYKNRLDDISTVWRNAGLPLDGSLPIKVTEKEPLPSATEIPIPRKVYEEIAGLIHDHLQTRKKPYEEARRLFQAIDPRNKEAEEALRPRIQNWIRVTEWFVERVHDHGTTDDNMGADELKKRFEIFEDALSAMVREFFKTVEEELDAILEEANV